MQGRPRRSVLYMPGSNERALEKAKTIPADALIFDLEDAVAPDAKALARDQVCAAVRNGGYGGREIVIRVNALETPWGWRRPWPSSTPAHRGDCGLCREPALLPRHGHQRPL
jgi:hypothetical protein